MTDTSLNSEDERHRPIGPDSGVSKQLTEDELALKRAILSKFNTQFAKSKPQLDEMLEELVRLNIR